MTLIGRISALATKVGADLKAFLSRTVPPGGATGEFLKKTSGNDYEMEWGLAEIGNMNSNYASGTGGTTIAATETAIGTVTITPQLSTSKIQVKANAVVLKDTGTTRRTVTVRIKRGSTQIGSDVTLQSQNLASVPIGMFSFDAQDSTHGTTSTITYTLYALANVASAAISDTWEIQVTELVGAQGAQGPAGGELTNGDKGDVTVSAPGGVTTVTINSQAVTLSKIQNFANKRLPGRNSSVSGPLEEMTVSQLLDWVGTTAEGDMLRRGASGWERFAKGAAGQILTMLNSTTQGWSSATSGIAINLNTSTVSATGTTTSDAQGISVTNQITNVSSTPSGSGVKFTTIGLGWFSIVKNSGANSLLVYPPTGGTIDGGSANAPVTILAGKAQIFFSTGAAVFTIL